MENKVENNFNLSGKVLFVGQPVFIKDTLSKRVLVVEAFAGKYPQEVPFDFVNERMDMLNNIRVGDVVHLTFELRGNKHIQGDGKARWFTNNSGLTVALQRDEFPDQQDPFG